MMRTLIKNKKADVWVSTVIYTLIGLSIIAILLAGLVNFRAMEQLGQMLYLQRLLVSYLQLLEAKQEDVFG